MTGNPAPVRKERNTCGNEDAAADGKQGDGRDGEVGDDVLKLQQHCWGEGDRSRENERMLNIDFISW